MKTHAVVYDRNAIASEHPGNVAELHLKSTAVAQVSELPLKPWKQNDPRTEREGFLIRVWQPNGLHQYGGNNLALLTVTVEKDVDGIWRTTTLNVSQQWEDM